MQINLTSNSSFLFQNLQRSKLSSMKMIGRLSSGKHSTFDQPSYVSQISRLETKIRSNQAAQRNIQDGISLIHVTDSAIRQMVFMGQRLRELAVQYNNGTLANQDKGNIETEAKALMDAMSKTIQTTTFNGLEVFVKDGVHIQASDQANDTVGIELPNLKKPTSVATSTKVDVESKTYEINASVPGGYQVKGQIVLDLRKDGSNSHAFSIVEGNRNHKGTLSFSSDKTARFELDWYGSKLTGTLNLNNESGKQNLKGVNSYTMDRNSGGWTSPVSFKLLSEQSKQITVTENIGMDQFNKLSVTQLLDTEFIDNNILQPLIEHQTKLGTKENELVRRLDFKEALNAINEEHLSRLSDVDVAKEMAGLAKEQLLLEVNVQLLHQFNDNHRNLILSLLK